MAFVRLLAKSGPVHEEVFSSIGLEDPRGLLAHLRSVYASSRAILERTGDVQLAALGLDRGRSRADLTTAVSLASVFHDLGKANSHFQSLIQGDPSRFNRPQGLRHEWVTYWLMLSPPINQWLTALSCEDIDCVFAARCAIIGHHPALGRPVPPTKAPDGSGSDIEILAGHKDFHAALKWAGTVLKLPPAPELSDTKHSLVGSRSIFTNLRQFHMRDVLYWESLPDEHRRFVAAVKACVLAADVGGSAIPVSTVSTMGESHWIGDALAIKPEPDDLKSLIAERVGCPVNDIDQNLRNFQMDVTSHPDAVTFVRAGCGTGKTLAAYNWARCCAPGRRVFFCYPTTGTATEGFRGYLYDLESGKSRAGARLFHSRKDVDMEMILAGDVGSREEQELDDFLRLRSLEVWSTPVVSCTVDFVLALLHNHRNGLYAWPALACGAFVFDEVHAYDDRLFGTLLRFIKEFRGAPILLMTASLPGNRFEALEHAVASRGSYLAVVSGPAETEVIPRYRLLKTGSETLPISHVVEAWESGGKVLWVANTVRRVQDAAQALEKHGIPVMLYHSRFRYEDRVRRHHDVVSAFEGMGPAVAVCSQVAEMSLDLSASLLVTDLAPVPSMIQRLGRLNRRTHPGLRPEPFIVVEPRGTDGDFTMAPYMDRDYGDWPSMTRQWLDVLPSDGASQSDLDLAWEEVGGRGAPIRPAASPWIDGGPVTLVTELREGAPGIPVVLESDAEAVKRRAVHMNRVLVPMPPPPRHMDWKSWSSIRGVPIAPENAIEYDPKRGGQWREPQP